MIFLATTLLAAMTAAPATASDIACHSSDVMQTVDVSPGVTLRQATVTCDAHRAAVSILTTDLKTANLGVQANSPLPSPASRTLDPTSVGARFALVLPSAAVATAVTLPGGANKSFHPLAGVNANLFTNCCTNKKTDESTYLRGLQITNGLMNVPVRGNADSQCSKQQGASCFATPFDATLFIDTNNKASIRTLDFPLRPEQLTAIVTAVTGSNMLVSDGKAVAPLCPRNGCTGDFFEANARTAVGVIGTDRLLMVAVDGRAPSTGLQLDEFAVFLRDDLHVDAAINLDGGGSTAMAVKRDGTVTVVNKPKDCAKSDPSECERYVGDVLMVGTTGDAAH